MEHSRHLLQLLNVGVQKRGLAAAGAGKEELQDSFKCRSHQATQPQPKQIKHTPAVLGGAAASVHAQPASPS